MSISWPVVKEIFFALGSVAGVLAFIRPLLESKHQRDQERLRRIFEILPEQTVIDLEPSVYQSRMVWSEDFYRFDRLAAELRSNQEGVRFIGPYGPRLKRELIGLIAAYGSLRDLIQVPWWEPQADRESGEDHRFFWNFNKSAFEGADRVPRNYAQHLDQCVDRVREIRRAYQRLQLVGELHLLELPFAHLLLKKRFMASGLA